MPKHQTTECYWIGLENAHSAPHGHGEDYREYVTRWKGMSDDALQHAISMALQRIAAQLTAPQDGDRIVVRKVKTTLYPPCTLYARNPLRYYESSARGGNPTMLKYEISSIEDDKYDSVCWIKTEANPEWHNPQITVGGRLAELMYEVENGQLIPMSIQP